MMKEKVDGNTTFLSPNTMLKPRAHEFNKNEAPKDERLRRVYNE
jgi:hypothetical protein